MATTCRDRSQVVISEQELQGHYCFRLQQVGFSEWMASSLAGLMIGFPDSSEIDERQMDRAIALLENQTVTPLMGERQRRKGRRRLRLAVSV